MTVLVGIPACAKLHDGRVRFDNPARYAEAVMQGSGCVPILIPPVGEAMLSVLDRLDGLLVPGSPSNVHPSHYDGGETQTPDLHDQDRDATTLPLIRAALARGVPVFAICRGIQELNVALGGTLHQKVHELPGRLDHRGGSPDPEIRYRPKHEVALTGRLASIIGRSSDMVNSAHGQAIDALAPGLAVEAMAPDGTIEGVRVEAASAFAIGVQWHPEWNFAAYPTSVSLFAAFGDACREHAIGMKRAA